jgi:hypothetical protein
MWGPVMVGGQVIHLPLPTVGPYVTAPPGPLVPLNAGWLRVVRRLADERAATARLLAQLDAPRSRPPPPRQRHRGPRVDHRRPRVEVADTPPVMLAWLHAGQEELARPAPSDPEAPGLAPIHAAAIAAADHIPHAVGWRPARRPRTCTYQPLYDGLADPDPQDVAQRRSAHRALTARVRYAREGA